MKGIIAAIAIVPLLAGCATELVTEVSYPQGAKYISVTASGAWPLRSAKDVNKDAKNVILGECKSYINSLKSPKDRDGNPIQLQGAIFDALKLLVPDPPKIPVHSYKWSGTCEQFVDEFVEWTIDEGAHAEENGNDK